MSNDNQEQIDALLIPDNIIKSGTIWGIPHRRWIEALVFSGCTAFLCTLSPFVIRIKIILIIVLCTTIFILSVRGIKNRSITEFIIDNVNFLKTNKKYHLASISSGRKKNSVPVKFGNESYFEQMVRISKTKFKEFDEKYGE